MASKNNLTVQRAVRFTADQDARVCAAAAAHNLTPAAYIRESALAETRPPLPDTDTLKTLLLTVKRCGSSVNQVAKAVNKYGAGAVTQKQVMDTQRALQQACESITTALEAQTK